MYSTSDRLEGIWAGTSKRERPQLGTVMSLSAGRLEPLRSLAGATLRDRSQGVQLAPDGAPRKGDEEWLWTSMR